jgi:uncharacterized membrane protein
MPKFNKAQRRILWLGVGLILAFWCSRLIALDVFPPFLDEVLHVRQAELSWTSSPLAYTVEGRLFTHWLHMLYQPYLTASTVWLMRAATLILLLPGFAALLGLGRLMAGGSGMALAGLFALFSTYHMFFERLALADALSGAAASLSLYFAYRLARRANLWDAALAGGALFLSVGFKATALPYLIVPVVAALILRPARRRWIDNIRWLAVALVGSVGLLAVFTLGLRLLGHDLFAFISLYNAGATAPLLERTVNNAESFIQIVVAYTGLPMFTCLVLALVMALLGRQQRHLYLVICLVGGLMALWVNERQFTRYFLFPTAIVLLCGAVILAEIIHKKSPVIRLLGLSLVLLWGIIQWVPFAYAAYNAPFDLPLAPRDYTEYVSSDASGFGLSTVLNTLRGPLVGSKNEVIGIFSNCLGLRYLAHNEPVITCPRLSPSGEDRAGLAALMAQNRRAGVYVVYESLPFVPTEVPGTLVVRVARPGSGSQLSLYSLAP